MATPPYDPFKGNGASPLVQRPTGYTYDDLMNPLSARAMVTPMPYNQAIYAPQQPFLTTPASASDVSLADQIGTPGKTALQLAPIPGSQLQPGEIARQPSYAPPAEAPPMGGLEAFGRGLFDQVLGFVPQELRQHIENGWGIIANILDIPFEIVGNLPTLPIPAGIPMTNDVQGTFARVPDTPQKQAAMQAMAGDPAHALWYMSEYLRQNEDELAHGLGVSPLVADFFVPSNNLGDQILKTLGLLGIPSRIVERTYAESGLRNADQSVLNADPATLNPALLAIRAKYQNGEISHTEFLDLLSREGFGFSNNPWDNMFMEIVTDPLNVALFAGVAEKAAQGGAMMARASEAVKLARTALPEAVLKSMDDSVVGRRIADFASRGMAMDEAQARALSATRDTERLDWLVQNTDEGQGFADQALAGMSGKDRALVKLEPIISKGASLSRALNSPFDLFGIAKSKLTGKEFRNGERIAAFSSRESVTGLVNAYGPERALSLSNFLKGLTGSDEAFTEVLGRAGANAEVGVQRDSLVRMVTANGSVPAYAPDLIVRNMSEVYHSRLAIQVEGFMRRVKRQVLSATRTGKAGQEQEVTRVRGLMAQYLGDIAGPQTDKEAILRYVEKADLETLSLIDELHWGWVVGDGQKAIKLARQQLLDAAKAERAKVAQMKGTVTIPRQEARAAKAEGAATLSERYTIIGPHLLTVPRAKRVLADIKAGRLENARQAVEQYSLLYENFAAKGLADDVFMRDLETFVQELLGKGNKGEALVRIPERAKLPPALRDWQDKMADTARRAGMRADDAYGIGIAPELSQRWRAVYDGEGMLKGVNAWTDTVPEIAAGPTLNSFSVIRDKMFRPIRGERLLEEARRTFRDKAVRDYELSYPEANRLFSAIRQKADTVGTMPRGLKAGELDDLLDEMELPAATKQRIGQRGIARLVAQAFEGDLMTVGLTQKISGKMKSAGTRTWGNNWLGVVSERLYPMVRFTYNPVFILQEAIEPFFWNLLHGIRPGIHWKEADVRAFEAMRRSGLMGDWADQWEYSPAALLMLGAKEANRVAGPGSFIGKAWGNFIGTGRRVRSLAELKRLAYVRQVSNEFGYGLRRMVEDLNPAMWDDFIREAGTSDPVRIGNWYWLNKALHDPDNPHIQTWLADATKSDLLGEMARVQMRELARLHHFVDVKAMRKAVVNGTYDEAMFRSVMDTLKADPGYIDRAWKSVNLNVDDWWQSFREALGKAGGNSPAAKRQAGLVSRTTRNILQARAKAMGYEESEYLALHASHPTQYLDSTRGLPTGSRYQLALAKDLRKFYGLEPLGADDEIVSRISREARAVSGTPDEFDAEALRMAEAERWVNDKLEPLDAPVRLHGSGINGEAGSDGAAFVHHVGAGLTYESVVEMAHNVMGPQAMEGAVLAQRQMPSMLHMLTGLMPDDTVYRIGADYFVQPGDLHMNRLRVEEMDAQNLLRRQADLQWSGGGADEMQREVLRGETPGSGNNYFSLNRQAFVMAKKKTKGKPNTGIHWKTQSGDHYFGWYDENGDLVATAKIKRVEMGLDRATPRPTTPGGPIERPTWEQKPNAPAPAAESYTPAEWEAIQHDADMARAVFIGDVMKATGLTSTGAKEVLRNISVDGVTGELAYDLWGPKITKRAEKAILAIYKRDVLPKTRLSATSRYRTHLGLLQPEVGLVGTDPAKQGRGYYGRLTDYIDNEGTFKWAEVTGRGSYDYPGSKAAAAWLSKRDHESTTALREAIASRLLAGFSYVTGQTGADPYDALAALQGMVEAMSGKHPASLAAADQSIRDMLDFSYVGGGEFTIPDWRQREMLESLMPARVRQGDSIAPTMESARAHGWVDLQGHDDMRAVVARGYKPDAELPQLAYEYTELPASIYAQMRDDYRQWAARANSDALLGRTDWTAADMQAMNVARYRMLTRNGASFDPETTLRQRAMAMNFEAEPHPGTSQAESFPNTEAVAGWGPEAQAELARGLPEVQYDLGRWWAPRVGEISGASVVHVSLGQGRHTIYQWTPLLKKLREGLSPDEQDHLDKIMSHVDGLPEQDALWLKDHGLTEGDLWNATGMERTGEWSALGPQTSIVLTGSDQSIEAAVIATGATFQRQEVWATSVEHVTAGTAMAKPGQAGWGHHWVTDFVMPKGVSTGGADEQDVARLIDDLYDNAWVSSSEDLIRMTVARPDGTRMLRVMHPPASFSANEIERMFPIDRVLEQLDTMGVRAERGVVRSYQHRVDMVQQAERRAGLLDFFDREGSFTDVTGRRITKANLDQWEWDARANWKAHDWTDPWIADAEARGYAHVVTGVRNRYRGEAVAQANLAYWRYLPDLMEQWRAGSHLLPPPLRGWHFQYGPRGVRGATYTDATLDSAMFMLKHADATTAVHEFFHVMTPQFEDSMVAGLMEAYAKANGLRRRITQQAGRPTLSKAAEEWLAAEFEKYATTATVRNPVLQSAFNLLGKIVKADTGVRKLANANEHVAGLFDQLFGQANHTLSAVPYHPDEYRVLSAARYMMGAAEDAAQKTHYYARGRNLIERSVNHPYLGYYPASYMWGKVVPELVKFLVREPFGVRAPMWGYEQATHVSEAIQLQLTTDPTFRDFVTKHPDLIRFVMMMLPGTPWDIPVNAPAWARHISETEMGNAIKERTGGKQVTPDLLKEIVDSANYAFGIGRSFTTIGGVVGEWNKAAVSPESGNLPPGWDAIASRSAGLSPADQELAAIQQELAPVLSATR